MPTELSAEQIAEAEDFIASVIEQNIDNVRVSEGTALRDLAIKTMAGVYALIQSDIEEAAIIRSLLTIQESVTDNTALLTDGTDALLSNWFITRSQGNFARGELIFRSSQKVDQIIPGNQRFLYDRARAFYPDVPDPSQNILIPATDLQPEVDTSTGVVTSYTFSLPVVASQTGESYNVAPSAWLTTGSFSSTITGAFNADQFTGGTERETNNDLIANAPNSIAERSMINERTITATLSNRGYEINQIQTIGFGDPEMIRDTSTIFCPSPNFPVFHTGGHYDVYVSMPPQNKVFTGTVGADYARPDGNITIFVDDTVADWTAEGVVPGDVISVVSGISTAPRDFAIETVTADELRVSSVYPFPEFASNVEYYIYRPIFGADVNVFPLAGTQGTGRTTTLTSTPNEILLPGEPHYLIPYIAILDPDPGDPAINGAEGYVYIYNRNNTTPVDEPLASSMWFQVINEAPENAQSSEVIARLVVPPKYNNKVVRVSYTSLAGFSGVDTFLRSRFERILAGDIQLKAFHPVYVGLDIQYSMKPTSPDAQTDEDELRQQLVEFFNNFDRTDVLDASDVSQFIKNFDSNIGTVYPITLDYTVIAPDGRVLQDSTDNIVDVSELLDLGLSSRTILYQSDQSLIGISLV